MDHREGYSIWEERRDFYVYVLFRPNGVPCYVGKGSGKRWQNHLYHGDCNPHLRRIIEKAGGDIPRVKIHQGLTEAEAFEAEHAFIAAIGRVKDGGPLVNMTDGGDGASGAIRSDETRAKMSAALKGKNIGKSRNVGVRFSDERKANISAAKIGRPNKLKGVPRTEDVKTKVSKTLTGRRLSDEHRMAISKGMIGRASTRKGQRRPEESIRKHRETLAKRRLQLSDAQM